MLRLVMDFPSDKRKVSGSGQSDEHKTKKSRGNWNWCNGLWHVLTAADVLVLNEAAPRRPTFSNFFSASPLSSFFCCCYAVTNDLSSALSGGGQTNGRGQRN